MSQEDDPTMQERILHCLSIYPILSPSMLQVGIGTNCSPQQWKPILRDLIEKGIVIETTKEKKTLTGRFFGYTKLYLAEHEGKIII